tara:strand:+ start:10841 stop:11749 length:909 start_codon:yes stop_codon:yes gene_type:complete
MSVFQEPIAPWFWALIGTFVGSFLNVCIYRLPLEDETVSKPVRSRCPKCKHQLTWWENLPVLSWVLLGARCRGCKVFISPRYPLVELLTGALWWVCARNSPGDWPLIVVTTLVLSGLIVATFVDFDRFEIPDEVSIGGCFVAPIACLAVPHLHEHTRIAIQMAGGGEVDRVSSLIGGLAGMAMGGGLLYGIGWVGSRIAKTDAMGFGDVKLMAAGGGFIGPGGVLYALLIAAFGGSIIGLGNMLRFLIITRSRARSRGRRDDWARSIRIARMCGRYIPFGPYLALGIGIVLLYWEDVRALTL